MDSTRKFAQEENIRNFSERLCAELLPEKRDLLRRLLVEEEDLFGYYSWHSDLVQRHIRECSARVQAQKALIARMQTNNQDTTIANQLLENSVIALEAFRDFSRKVVSALRQNPPETDAPCGEASSAETAAIADLATIEQVVSDKAERT